MQNKGIILSTVFASLAILFTGTGQISGELSNPNGDDVDAMELRSIIVEGWETGPWDAIAKPGPPESTVEVNTVNGIPRNLSFDENNKKSMGLRFQFIYPGNNTVILTPPEDRVVKRYAGQLDENNQPRFIEVPGIELPGKVHAVSVWVLGRGNAYSLEGWIQDWKGDTHIYKFGSLDYIGWRPLTIEIPESVPQDVNSYPQTKTLILKKLVLRSKPQVSQEKVVLFFDSLKVLTDMYDLFFDGADLYFDEEDKEDLNRLDKYTEQLGKYSGKETSDNNGGNNQ